MAQVMFVTRGMKQWVDQFITELQGKYYNYSYNGEPHVVQGMLRPIEFWEYCYPIEQEALVLNTLFDTSMGKSQHKLHGIPIKILQKALGLKPIPDYPAGQTNPHMPITRQNIEVVAIGKKNDYWTDPDQPGKYLKRKEDGGPKTHEGL